MSYCLLADLKQYLNIDASNTSDDTLLQRILDAATSRIDSRTQRTFQAASDTTRYFDPTRDTLRGLLWLDADLSNVTSIINGDGVTLTASDWYHDPRNETPWFAIGLTYSSVAYWTYTTNPQNAISITGRWAYMMRGDVTSIARATNVVTAQVIAPNVNVGQTVYVLNVADATFNGAFTVTSNTGSAITWAQTAANDTDTTGLILFTPSEIVQATRRLAAWLYKQKDTAQSGTSVPLFTADGSIVMPSTLPQDVEDILRPFYRML